MAIQNLERELEQVFAQIFKPGQLNPKSKKKGSKSSGSEDPVRALLDLYAFKFNIKKKDIIQQLKEYKVSTGKRVGGVKIFKTLLEENPTTKNLLEATANQLIEEFKKTEPKSNRNAYDFSRINLQDGGVQLIFTPKDDKNETSIYNAANDLKTTVSKKVFTTGEGKKLFDAMAKAARESKITESGEFAGEKLTYGGVFNVGHSEPVAKMSAAFLQDGVDSIEDNELISEDISTLKGLVKTKLGKFDLNFSMAREAAVWENGRLKPNATSTFYVETDLETKFKNQVQNQLPVAEGGEGARQVGEATGELISELRNFLRKRYQEYSAKGWTERATSTPFIDQIGAGIVFDKSLRELYKRGLAKNLTKWQSIPKNTPLGRTKNKTKKYTTKQKTHNLLLGTPKGIKRKGRAEKSLESSTFDAFEARAFINSRLSKQVAQNMGRPALENRTGRFANSVNVVNATKYGDVTNIDYTYDRERYGVFEGGRNYPKGYDPRPLIERSIKELAIAKMQSKFTFRRV